MSTTAQAKAYAAGALLANAGILAGFSLRDTSGAANTIKLFDNLSAASGTVIAVVQLAANASQTVAIPDGVWVASGLFAQQTGAAEGSVWIR
jgi:hypothetical protein